MDPHPLFLAGVTSVFETHAPFKVVATGTTAEDAIDIARTFQPGLLILDLNIDPREPSSTIAAITSVARATRIIVFTATGGIDSAARAFESGVSGYLLKSTCSDELISAAEIVLRGGTIISPVFAAQVVTALRTAALRRTAVEAMRLSVREHQILQLLLQGRTTNKEIADSLSISVKTVKYYMTILMQKLRARNRLEVVMAAQKMDDFQQGLAGHNILHNQKSPLHLNA